MNNLLATVYELPIGCLQLISMPSEFKKRPISDFMGWDSSKAISLLTPIRSNLYRLLLLEFSNHVMISSNDVYIPTLHFNALFYLQNNYFLVSNAHCHQEMLVCSFLLYYFTSILLFILFLQLRTLEIRQEWPEENGKMWMVHKPEEPLGQYVVGLVSIGFWCVEMGASNCKVVLHEVISNEDLHEFT